MRAREGLMKKFRADVWASPGNYSPEDTSSISFTVTISAPTAEIARRYVKAAFPFVTDVYVTEETSR